MTARQLLAVAYSSVCTSYGADAVDGILEEVGDPDLGWERAQQQAREAVLAAGGEIG